MLVEGQSLSLVRAQPTFVRAWLAFKCCSCKQWRLCGEEMYVAWADNGEQLEWCSKCKPDLKYSAFGGNWPVVWSQRYDGQLIAATKTTPPTIFVVHPPRSHASGWTACFCSGPETGRLVHYSLEKEVATGAVEALAHVSILNRKKPFPMLEELRLMEEVTEDMAKTTYKIPRLPVKRPSAEITLSQTIFPREIRSWAGFKCEFCQRTFLEGSRHFLLWDIEGNLHGYCGACKPEVEYRPFVSPILWEENKEGDFVEGQPTLHSAERFTINMTIQNGSPCWCVQFVSGAVMHYAGLKDRAKGLVEVLVLRHSIRSNVNSIVAKMNLEKFFHHWKSESGSVPSAR